jgi:hypothetical protein
VSLCMPVLAWLLTTLVEVQLGSTGMGVRLGLLATQPELDAQGLVGATPSIAIAVASGNERRHGKQSDVGWGVTSAGAHPVDAVGGSRDAWVPAMPPQLAAPV